MEDSGGLIQVIVFILITLGYAIVTIVKKANEWINKNRIPRHARQDEPDGEPRQERPRRSTVLEELEKALREAGRPDAPEPAPRPAEKPQPSAEAAPRQSQPEARRSTMRSAAMQMREGTIQAAAGTLGKRAQPKPTMRKGAGMPTHKAATIKKRHYGHLATLGNMDDLRRAILARQILEPCPAARRLPGRQAPRA